MTEPAARSRTTGWIAAGTIAVALVALVTLLAVPPASLLDRWLREASGGRVRLAEPDGTLWQGSGRLVLVDIAPAREGTPAEEKPPSALPLTGFALPGTLRWRISPKIAIGVLDASVSFDGTGQPVHLVGALATGVRVGAGVIDWPGIQLAGLGSPWNTLRPVASARLTWEPLVVDSQGLRGALALELRDVGSALSPVRPLGSWRVDTMAAGRQAELRVVTLAGPVNLDGEGRWSASGGLRLRLAAWPDPERAALLAPLLNLIGPREGDRTVIRIGA